MITDYDLHFRVHCFLTFNARAYFLAIAFVIISTKNFPFVGRAMLSRIAISNPFRIVSNLFFGRHIWKLCMMFDSLKQMCDAKPQIPFIRMSHRVGAKWVYTALLRSYIGLIGGKNTNY